MKTLIRATEWILHKWWLWLLLVLICSCTSTKYVPVENITRDTCYIKQVERDSIYERDSVLIYLAGDTVYHTRIQWKLRDRIVRDTVRILRCDTLSRVVEVEKNLSRLEELKMDIGSGVLWAIPIIIGLFVVYRKFIK